MERYESNLIIADIPIQILSDFPLEETGSFAKFAKEKGSCTGENYCIDFREVSELQIPEGICVYEKRETMVFLSNENEYFRVFREYYEDMENYAVAHYDWDKKYILVEYLLDGKRFFKSVQSAFRHVAWEVVLMNERKLMLHASYVKTPFGGIAFSGPSGIGKTTQAELWCQYGKGEMLNGDKIILGKEQGCWTGYGSPYAGSSRCYVNDSCKLNYLFFLKQGKACSLRRMGASESFKHIYSGLTLNRWDRDYMNCVCDLAQQLSIDIPAYEFICTPDEEAVHFLQEMLQGEDLND